MHTYALDVSWPTVLKDLNVRPADVLRRAGLPDDLFTLPNTRLPAEDYHRLWNALDAEVDDPAFAIQLCDGIRSEAFSPVLFAALCSPNLAVAAQRMSQFKPLVGPMVMQVCETPGKVEIELAWRDGVPQPPLSLVWAELIFAVAIARMGTRETVRPLAMTTASPPAAMGPYRDYLGIPVTIGSTHSVVFAAADAHRPFLTASAEMWDAFEPQFQRNLAALSGAHTTTDRVRAALLEGLPSAQFSSGQIARKLGMSRRTMQRRVEAEGTTFQALLRQTRLELARHYLAQTTLPTSQIAFLLGFAEPTSFHRAFRSWTGTTPDHVRRQLAATA